ncbi:DUF1294 domain-containing protein [Evansella sp. AB-P1]|uniref:DUF1294 domain-containing protein n=1 Tax=Evansella sp. AB-P1 TaxID=3037653 RepID=UPI00241CF7BC|nr:DUF1294 domain-containing protein [Evansella sp. AB-P1]MDG5786952.1 DUF1294 domain-containing protein [Evansella sp. AB-P1]
MFLSTSFIIYIVLINITGFIFMGIDKQLAIKQKHRISEKTLMFIAIFGASFFMVIASRLFRHKTRKPMFSFGLPLIALIHILLIVLVLT